VSAPGPGDALFARYAYAPNELGYCGPAQAGALLGRGAAGAAVPDLRALARTFHGAWPYLEILAAMTGVGDPLDRRVVEAYWLGGGLADAVDGREFGAALLARIGPQARHYWRHLTGEILDEAAPHHCFHVFGVYPWSRLLGPQGFEHPLRVLDGCRIRWGTVVERGADHVLVRNRRLTWDGLRLGLSEPRTERATLAAGGLSLLPDVQPGERVALHWEWTTDRLDDEQVAALRRTTQAQIEVTNRRLARERAR
jgi:hypothetical protein